MQRVESYFLPNWYSIETLAGCISYHTLLVCANYLICRIFEILVYLNDTAINCRQAIRNRLQKNAITLLCEVYTYIIESFFLIALVLTAAANLGRNVRNYIVLLMQFEFAISSTVQALSSAQTRQIYQGYLTKMIFWK